MFRYIVKPKFIGKELDVTFYCVKYEQCRNLLINNLNDTETMKYWL